MPSPDTTNGEGAGTPHCDIRSLPSVAFYSHIYVVCQVGAQLAVLNMTNS